MKSRAGIGQVQKEKGQAEAMLTAAFCWPRQWCIDEYGLDFPTEHKPGPDKEPGL